jgi:uncharacterized OsmC-like protein
MATTGTRRLINGIDAQNLREYIEACAADPSKADRNPEVITRWVGGTRAEVISAAGGPPVYMGGEDDPSAMGMLLRTLAACDVEVVANACALIGVEIEELTIEARGYFNVRSYLGAVIGRADAAEPGQSGYQRGSYTVHLRTKNGASAAQIDAIRRACLEGSPVGDTLEVSVPVTMELDVT